MSLVESGWDADAARRPHGQRTTVVVHLDVKDQHRAICIWVRCSLTPSANTFPAMPPCEVWFHRDGQVIGAGRTTRTINRRLAAPWSTATPPARCPGAGPPAVCTPTTSGTGKTAAPPNWTTSCCCAPTTTGCITAAPSPSPDHPTTSPSQTVDGRTLSSGSLARPPNQPPPDVAPYRGPTRRTRPMEVVRPLRTKTTHQQLARSLVPIGDAQ